MERKIRIKNENTNSKVDKREHRRTMGGCDICPPNRGCNDRNWSKHGKGKAKYKSKRKGKV